MAAYDPYAALRVPSFRRYLIGSALVWIGSSAQTVAVGWEVYTRTGQALSLGLTGLVQAIPMLLFTLPAGYFADLWDRRRLVLLSLVLTTVTSLALGWFSYIEGSIDLMYLLLFLDAAALRLGAPARAALTPLLVDEAIFENAVKWRTSVWQISLTLGPALGGFIIAWSLPSAYVLSAVCSCLFALLVPSLRVREGPRVASGQMVRHLLQGVAFVWQRKLLLGAVSLDLFAVLLGGAVYLLPIYATDILQVGARGLGWLRAAPALGAFCMALLMAYLPPMRRVGVTLFVAVACFGVATIVFGVATSFPVALAALFVVGASDNISVVVRQTVVQLATPNELRGRVSAVNTVFIGSSNELGGFESGALAQAFGPVVSVVSGGLGTLLVVATWIGLFPELRRARKLSAEELRQ